MDDPLVEELEEVKAKVGEIYCGMKQEEPKEEKVKNDGKEEHVKGEQAIRVEDEDSFEDVGDEEYDDEDEFNESDWTSDEDSHCSEESIRNCPDCCKRNSYENMEMNIKAVAQELHAKLVAGTYPPPIPKELPCHLEREEKSVSNKTVEPKVVPVVQSKQLPALKKGFFLNNPAKEVAVKKGEEEKEKEVESGNQKV